MTDSARNAAEAQTAPRPEADLRRRSVRGGAVTLVAQACKAALMLAATAILVRLLEPADFGLLAMIAAVTAFVVQFRDLGLSMSTIQKAEISDAQVSTLFWINAAFAALLAALTALLAPALAWFYDEPRLVPVARTLSLGILAGGLAVQHLALLRRQMRFSALAAIEVTAMACAAAAAVISAWQGAGYWALVVLELVLASVMLLGAWALCDWRPGRPARGSDVRGMIAFGSHLTGFNLANYLIRNLDNLLIGWRWGPQALGLYAKAYDLLTLPLALVNTPLSTVAIPGLSRLQHDAATFRTYYLRALSVTAFLTLPLAAFMIVMADEVVAVLLGPRWKDAAGIFRLLAISAALQPLANTAGWLYIATGRTGRMLRWGVFAAIVVIAAFVIGLPYGPPGVALAYSVAVVALMWPCMKLAVAGSPVGLIDVCAATWRPAAAAVLSAGAVQAVMIFAAPGLPAWGAAVLGATIMSVLYFGMLLGFASTRNLYREVLKELIGRGAARDVRQGVPA